MTAPEDTEAYQAGQAGSSVLARAAEAGPAWAAAGERTEADKVAGHTEADQAGSLLRRRAAGAAELASVLQSAHHVAPQLATCPIVLPGRFFPIVERIARCISEHHKLFVRLALF